MNSQKEKNYINNIYWDRIHLNITFKMQEELQEVYLISNSEQHRIPIKKTDKNGEYSAQINITNLDGKMLENGVYKFKIKREEEYEVIHIEENIAYKLENLDKIFRYYRNVYAYTITFEVQQTDDENLICVLRSEYMKLNKNPRNRCISNKNVKKMLIGKALHLTEIMLQSLYKLFSFLHPNKNNKILLMSETRHPIGGNLKALDERLKERKLNETYKISYSFSATLQEGNIHIILKWLKLIWVLSKQEFVFIDDYSPIFKVITLSKKTKLIQVWHAGVGFKAVGYARFGFAGPEPYRSCHRKYDYAIVGEESLIPVYEEVFGISKEKILPYGLPRMDYFFDKDRIEKITTELYGKYPELETKKVILFAPTYRGKGQAEAYYPEEKIDLNKIYQLCKKGNYVFIMKMHPFIKNKIEIPKEYSDCIKDFSDYTDINNLFYISDILITDYSSNVYEFSKLKRPIILYTFDLDKYELIHKVHRSVEEYEYATVCYNMEELIENIEKVKVDETRKIDFEEHKKASDLIIDNIILRGKNSEKNINNGC